MENLPDQFRNFIEKIPGNKIPGNYLLAVSGGVDSMVMMHLFFNAGYSCHVSHCNFQLRGQEADHDEALVREVAKSYGFPIQVKRFNTREHATNRGISIQMAARELRYAWFDELAREHQLEAIAVAQHADDVAETMLLNLARGTGLAGMQGIHAIRGNIIRPLISLSKESLIAYARDHDLKWREDVSNEETVYQRNKIRHQVLPVLHEINPAITAALNHHAQLMEGYELLLTEFINQMEAEIVNVHYHGTVKTISLEKLLKTPAPGILLFHLLKASKPNSTLCTEILAASGSGAEFFSNGYRIVRDREELTIFSPEFSVDAENSIRESDQKILLKYGALDIEPVNLPEGVSMAILPGFGNPDVAYIDAAVIKFPLTLRNWRKGDYFHPMGMQGSKLLSDYFIDEKFTSAMKEIVYLLVSGKEVIWVVGHRIDERFKIQNSTKKSIRFTYKPDL